MLTCGRENRDLRDDGLKTLECLRGRLQAERQASRSAKMEAEVMGKKLIELEKELKEELKLKKRAEKKLKLLKKKLESLGISKEVLGSNGNDFSEIEVSCGSSSSTSSKDHKELEGQEEPILETKNTITSPMRIEGNASQTSIEEWNSNPQSSSISNSNARSNETSSSTKSSQGYEDSKIYQESFSSSQASKTYMEMEDDEFVDDTWALVPVTWPAAPEKPEAVEERVIGGNVGEVLDVLRHARERLKCSLEGRRNMIRVGPSYA